MLLRYSRLLLEAMLLDGKTAYSEVEFKPGGNVIVTDDNTQGKSTIVNALSVGLGFDDLVKGNVAALVKDTVKIEGRDRRIREALIYLEIANEKNEYATICRSVNPELATGITVRRGRLSDWSEDGREEYYLGSGSYKDTKGFHRFLCEFIDFPVVNVVSQDDKETRLYLEYVFSAIFIEQKRGWADIMANMPFYRVRDPKKSTISELIGLDYIKSNLRRNELRFEEQRLRGQYEAGAEVLKRYINSKHFSVKGLPSEIASGSWSPAIFRASQDVDQRSLDALIASAEEKLAEIEDVPEVAPAGEDVRKRLDEHSGRITSLVSRKGQIDNSVAIVEANIRRYRQRLEALKVDLQKNKEELRVRSLFNRDNWSVRSACPVCDQPVDGTLLSQLRSFPTMSIEENVKYITDQRDLLEGMIAVETVGLDQSKAEANQLSDDIASALASQAALQRSLSGVLPSELMARARDIAKLENEIEAYTQLKEYSAGEFAKLKEILDRYQTVSGDLAGTKSDLSAGDRDLLRKFQTAFQEFLRRMGFNSVEVESMVIDQTSFLPRIIVNDATRRRVRADFGTSASDWIRIITAFVLALHACRGNSSTSIHPNVTVFDEPAQQNMNKDDTLQFYDIVADVAKRGQIIVAATDKDHSVSGRARSLGMHVVDFGRDYVLRLRSN